MIENYQTKESGKRLEILTKGSKGVVFAEPGQSMPKLYIMSYPAWNAKGNPEVVFV